MASCSMEQHLRSYVVDIQQRLERGRQDAVNFDYILFRIDWLINLLIRYTSDERNAGPNILQRVINLLREVKDMLSRHSYENSTSYQTGKIFTGTRGRPKFNIQREHLEFLVEQGFNSPAIAGILGVSLRTIERRQQEFGIRQRSTYSVISEHDLDNIIENILVGFPETGYKRMTGFLRSRGVVVQQSRIREAMRRVNPEGTMLRALQLHVTHRRSYQVSSPLALWHIDGNHKLIRYFCYLSVQSFIN